MATNPQYPPQKGPQEVKRYKDDHAKLQVPPRRAFPWTIIAIIIAAAILAALIYWLPQTPHRHKPPTAAQVPQQPTGNQVQFFNLKMQPAPIGSAFYLDGLLQNNGPTDITGLQVQAEFLGTNGQILETQTRAAQEITPEGNGPAADFTQAPIKPGQSRPFRLYLDHYPAGWNKQMPQLKVTAVTGTTP